MTQTSRHRQTEGRTGLQHPAWRGAALLGALLAALVAWALAMDPARASQPPADVLDGAEPQPRASGELPPMTVTPLSGGMTRVLLPPTTAASSAADVVGPRVQLASLDAALGLDHGHVDLLAPQVVDGELVMTVRDDTRIHDPSIEFRDPADVAVQATETARQSIPEEFTMLGTPGDPVWILPQTQDPALPWLGWSTEHPSLVGAFDGPVTFRLTEVSGPGRVVLFQTVGFGDTRVIASTADGVPASWTEPVPAHVHASWAFGAPGTYTLVFEASATRSDGTDLSTGPVPYTFVVEGDTDESGDPGGTDDTDGDGASDDATEGTEGTDDGASDQAGDADDDGAAGEAAQAGGTGADGGDGQGSGDDGLADTGFDDAGVVTASAVSLLLFGVALIGQPRRRPAAAT